MNRLKNQTTLITGGNSGIGYATAQLFKAEGANVIITGRNESALNKAANELSVKGYVADQADMCAIDSLVATVKASFGKLDAIFLNAGIATFAPFEQADELHYNTIMDTNVKGVFFTIQKLLPLLNSGGAIIFNTSINASIGMPGSGVYAASKAALVALSRVLATELAGRNIRVNCISPGPVETPVYQKLGMTKQETEAFGKVLSEKILLKRFAQAEEIAQLAVFLASSESSFITGTEIIIDGGIKVNPVMH
ncbi:SDR family oxidoreductase [Mucilaginibacter auburnensis]|uniref:NAD(P)-dependent dehydrogenase (Short-subunit alcohol dehydrogenase family) n=1 Tax=Mucilaginibacter auburnensis TaxID=1457233 RepID=A0A2H9VW29_9SPHI|nr:SDR family oxidoreductase [Mucilaginibacter auburnensis]PJJ85034.1 NAD(P)-dependent dehydrogenase (short-subunit alcohol dehydrogenase family) [Mucilaginibacter auburnensis]